jgi:hypothetical protein
MAHSDPQDSTLAQRQIDLIQPAARYSQDKSLPMGTERSVVPRYVVVGAGLTNLMSFTNSSPLQTAVTVVSVLICPSQHGCAAHRAGGS